VSTDKRSMIHVDPDHVPELTPAASEKLEQNIEYVRAQILREISRVSAESGHRASASDVDNAVSRIRFFDSASKYATRLAPVSIVASICAVLGQITILAMTKDTAHINGLALLVGVTAGATTTAATLLIIQEFKRHRRVMWASQREFLQAFVQLEDRLRKEAQELLGPIADSTSLGRSISAVELLQLWTPEDSLAFRRLLGIRNSIVHEDSRDISAEKLTEAFSRIARLSALLEMNANSRTRRKINEAVANRSALSYEERVTDAMRKARLEVCSTQGDADYDLLVGRSDFLKRVVFRYRRSGLLTVNDISGIVDGIDSLVGTVVITNAEISPYVYEYLGLAQESSGDGGAKVSVVSWRNDGDTRTLVQAIVPEIEDLGIEKGA
jgi:hypothetical protein